MNPICQDIRHAARALRTSPLFTLVSVLSLAIGIAGTAVVFNVADTYLFQPRGGMTDVARLVEVGRTDGTEGGYRGGGFNTFSYPNYLDYRARQTVFDGLAVSRMNATFGLGSDKGSPVRVTGSFVSANYFSVLGVTMQLGRGFRPEEESSTGPVTVVSNVLSAEFHTSANSGGTLVPDYVNPTYVTVTLRVTAKGASNPIVLNDGFNLRNLTTPG